MSKFIKEVKSFVFWSFGLMFGVFMLFGGLIVDNRADNQNHVTKEELSYYVDKDQMVTFFIKEMNVIQKIMLMKSANVPDSLINQVFEQNEWFLQQMGDVNPRSVEIIDEKEKYSDILKQYANKK